MTTTVLSDKNCEGHAIAIHHALIRRGYIEMLGIKMVSFNDVGLDKKADDETVWKFCQQGNYLLLTGNRTTTDGDLSLGRVMQRLATELSLPVLTIGDLDRVLKDGVYCEDCAEAIATIILDLDEKFRGNPRLFIPFQNP